MSMLGLAAIALTTAFLIVLCLNDPKRRRTAKLPGEGHGATTRRLLAAAACLPGIACLLLGDAAAFLVWIGGLGVAGWFVTLIATGLHKA
jgi:hypothetical protein